MRLRKHIFGYEHNTAKTPFGFLNEQIRSNAVVKSGGWYNYDSQKIGRGDLSMADLATVAAQIPAEEAFFVLSEGDAFWGVPEGVDTSEPGIEYVVRCAIWMVSRSTGIVRVRDNIYGGEYAEKDGVKYTRIPREGFIDSFAGRLTKKATIASELNSTIDLGKALDTFTKKKPLGSILKSSLPFGSLGARGLIGSSTATHKPKTP
jgi:hypothetical protein